MEGPVPFPTPGSSLALCAVTALALAQAGCGQTEPSDVSGYAGEAAVSASGAPAASSGGARGDGTNGSPAGSDGGAVTSGGAVGVAGSSGAAGGGPSGGAPASCAKWFEGNAPASEWAYIDAAGALAYKTIDSRGDRMLDFSYAGYRGGGVALPRTPTKRTVEPSGGDDTRAIQDALDAVAQLPQVDGARGAVELSAGSFRLNGSLRIATSGVVLRGAGSSQGGTVLKVEGSPRTLITLAGSGKRTPVGTAAKITDGYVPSGSQTLHVDSAGDLTVGDDVLVQRPVTEAWLHLMGMDTLVRNGAPQTWLDPGSLAAYERRITAIDGTQITIEPGVPDSIDAKYLDPPGGSLSRFAFTGRISEVGVEALRVTAPPASVPINKPTFRLITADAVTNSWIDDVHADGFINGLQIGRDSKWMTIRKVSFVQTAPVDNAAGYPADFACSGQQILFSGCGSEGSRIFSFVTQALVAGPNVVLDFVAKGDVSMQPHQRWATGLLLDNVKSPMGKVELINRKTAGSGHGWTIGWGVVWNAVASELDIQRPPGSENWAIGSMGATTASSTGTVESHGIAVKPGSLYLAQLCQRLGPEAVASAGYD